MKRFAVRFAVVLLAVLIALPAGFEAGAGAARDRAGKGRRSVHAQATTDVVTRSFQSTAAIAVPAAGTTAGKANPYPSTIAVSGLEQRRIVDVNLELRGFGHTYPGDVDVLLVAPGGRNAIVMSDAGGNPDVTNLTLTLDDEAADGLPTSTALTSGAFRPTNHGAGDTFPAPAPSPSGAEALSTFDGIDPNGTWSLYVADAYDTDIGSIANGWKLTITAEIPASNPPAAAPVPAPTPNADRGNGPGNGNGKGKGNGNGHGKGKGNGNGNGHGNGPGKGHGKNDGKGKGKGNGNGHGNGQGGGKGKNGRGR